MHVTATLAQQAIKLMRSADEPAHIQTPGDQLFASAQLKSRF
jgi:hypothetical protein